MRSSTVKVPTLTGRVAWLGCIATAVLSFWLLDAPQLGSAGSKLALAGGAVVIGLGRLYRSELVEVPSPSDADLGPRRARIRSILNAARWATIGLGLLALAAFVIELNYRRASLMQPVVLSLGAMGFGLILVREGLSAMLASGWFREPA